MKKYKLLKDFEDPNGRVMAGVIKDKYQWCARFALLNHSDLDIKKDWFEEVNEEPKEFTKQDMIDFAEYYSFEYYKYGKVVSAQPEVPWDNFKEHHIDKWIKENKK